MRDKDETPDDVEAVRADELGRILEQHRMWCADLTTGARADLRDADLHGADLFGANLFGANLSGANLSGVNLDGADLCDAKLFGADLHFADLHDADLRGADLRDADLHYADLRGANLRDADLRGADLRYANFRYADLHSANLRGADLRCANLHGAHLRGCTSCIRLPVADPRGYEAYAVAHGNHWKIKAGCYWMTLAEARSRWGNEYKGDRPIGDQYLSAFDWLEANHELPRDEPKGK